MFACHSYTSYKLPWKGSSRNNLGEKGMIEVLGCDTTHISSKWQNIQCTQIKWVEFKTTHVSSKWQNIQHTQIRGLLENTILTLRISLCIDKDCKFGQTTKSQGPRDKFQKQGGD
jgi:hypothetical protein